MLNTFNFEPKPESEVLQMNAQVLAFVGDAVQSLYVKTHVALTNNTKSGGLHKLANEHLKASGQNSMVLTLLDSFNPTELAVFKRGRNYKTQSIAKHAQMSDYKNATGWESVLGYLYLTGKTERLNELLEVSLTKNEEIK